MERQSKYPLLPCTTLFRCEPLSSATNSSVPPGESTSSWGGPPTGIERITEFVVRSTSETVPSRSEEHTSELQSLQYLVCRLLLEKKKLPSPAAARYGCRSD